MSQALLVVMLLSLSVAFSSTSAAILELTESNFKRTLATPRLSFVSFHVDWCPHSQSLKPIIDRAAKELETEYPDPSLLTFARVDGDAEPELAKRHGVMKYPTMKIFRYGASVRLEYRGQRSVDAIKEFVRAQLSDSLTRLAAPVSDSQVPVEPRQKAMIGRFRSNDSAGLDTFLRVAELLRDEECVFLAIVGEKDEPESVVYQRGTDMATQISLDYIEEIALKRLAFQKCMPIVRELTFENAEAITEEGLPLFVLFYRDDGSTVVDKYKSAVENELKKIYRQDQFFVRSWRLVRSSNSSNGKIVGRPATDCHRQLPAHLCVSARC
ncbi:hypothetical protein BOX15_Mlig026010g1 [Macrostomum lignano]|uniref:Thioredoxin domain-containing protein n=1 Tax=Macrostomum lignano TaxID=282301 RepID=A0A267ES47_9PLAT|nr:hypothetical protein BOX15_Mlig026010g1 [Macrostomum lignano]